MTEQFNNWLNSGRFVYCLVLTASYMLDEKLKADYPDATDCGIRKILNVEKSEAAALVEYLGEVEFEFSELSVKPMLLTHEQAALICVSEEGA